LREDGWKVNAKRVARLWRREGLKVPHRPPKRGRLWLADGACLRVRPEHPNHVWAYDFLTDRTHDGRALRRLTIMDACTREALAIVVARTLTADDVLATLTDVFLARGYPGHLRSDNGPEFCATSVRAWLAWLEVRPLFIEPGSPWEHGYSESFNGTLRDDLLDRELFYTLREAQVLTEGWRQHYNTVRPHSALGYRPPAPAAVAFSALTPLPLPTLALGAGLNQHCGWTNQWGQVTTSTGSVARRPTEGDGSLSFLGGGGQGGPVPPVRGARRGLLYLGYRVLRCRRKEGCA
jgi:transposase InsO family protein